MDPAPLRVRLRFGLMYLQAAPFGDLVARVRRGEEMGFDSLWVADHMTGQYPGLISFEAWTLLGALAMSTSKARLGTLVTPITFRHPSLLAMSATTVDHASGGRLEIGLGIGGAPVDSNVVGVEDWRGPERVARLEEQVDILDRLLRGETIQGHRGHYPTEGAVVEPPVQRPRPPLVLAADGPRLLDLAARRADAWNTLGGQPMRGSGREAVSLDEAVDATRPASVPGVTPPASAACCWRIGWVRSCSARGTRSPSTWAGTASLASTNSSSTGPWTRARSR
jgi:alkanesulfonate monooxygenase SsuD/methylene tetrahydromethanopterin reductase-like flavin-dependent oxidoreductase (luciferase family)